LGLCGQRDRLGRRRVICRRRVSDPGHREAAADGGKPQPQPTIRPGKVSPASGELRATSVIELVDQQDRPYQVL
jgi:hypothetical protein